MKVFELMCELTKMPAGADVTVSLLMSVEELTKYGVAVCDHGVKFYDRMLPVAEVEDNECEVLLHLSDEDWGNVK